MIGEREYEREKEIERVAHKGEWRLLQRQRECFQS